MSPLVELVESTFSESDFVKLSQIPKKIGLRLASVKTKLIDTYEECLRLGVTPVEVFIYIASQEAPLCTNGDNELKWKLKTLNSILLSDKLSYITICEDLNTSQSMLMYDMYTFTNYLNQLLDATKDQLNGNTRQA
jgi:hypothetical protein